MKKKDHRLRVGVTLTFLVSILFVLVFSLDSALSWWTGTKTVRVHFANVQGIRTDDPVHFHGVPCGRVAAVEFINGGDSASFLPVAMADEGLPSGVGVCLALEVPLEIGEYLRSGSKASIEKTLTGVTVVKLEQGDGDPLGNDAFLVGSPVASIDDVTARLNDAVGETVIVMQQIRESLEEIREGDLLVGTLRTFQGTAEETQTLARSLRELVEENRDSLRELSEHGSGLLSQLDESAAEIPALLDRMSGTALDVGEFTSDMREWFRDRRGDLSDTTEDIAESASNLKNLSTELRRRPWRLLHSPNKEEALALELYESVEVYARGAVELRRSLDRSRVLLEYSGDDPRLQTLIEKSIQSLEGQIERQAAVEQVFWERLQSLDD